MCDETLGPGPSKLTVESSRACSMGPVDVASTPAHGPVDVRDTGAVAPLTIGTGPSETPSTIGEASVYAMLRELTVESSRACSMGPVDVASTPAHGPVDVRDTGAVAPLTIGTGPSETPSTIKEPRCKLCSEWRPIKWDPHTGCYEDVIARCSLYDKWTTYNEHCDMYQLGNAKKRLTKNIIGGLKAPLMNHQIEAVERFKNEASIPIFWDPGVGKSCAALRIAAQKFKAGEIEGVLIIAPNRVHYQWYKQEIPDWLADVPYSLWIYGGDGGHDYVSDHGAVTDNRLHILVCNVDRFSYFAMYRAIHEWTVGKRYGIILDEATKIKSIKSGRGKRITYGFSDIKAIGKRIISNSREENNAFRMVLTGTPYTNNVTDLWAIMEFCRPGFFGLNYDAFVARYTIRTNTYEKHGSYALCAPSGRPIKVPLKREVWEDIKGKSEEDAVAVWGISHNDYLRIQEQDAFVGPIKNEGELKKQLDSLAVFQKIEECVDMPEKVYIKRVIPMRADQLKAYQDMETEGLVEIEGKECSMTTKLGLYIRLAQISSGFVPMVETPPEGDEEALMSWLERDIKAEPVWFKDVAKLQMLESELEERTGPIIIITRWTAEAVRIEEMCISKGYRTMMMTGYKKTGSVELFQRGMYDVLVANVAVVSLGLNLQRASTVIFYSNSFSLENRLQSEGRIYRVGQQNRCVYLDLVNEGTIDMRILAALRQHKNMLDYITSKDPQAFLSAVDESLLEEFPGWVQKTNA